MLAGLELSPIQDLLRDAELLTLCQHVVPDNPFSVSSVHFNQFCLTTEEVRVFRSVET